MKKTPYVKLIFVVSISVIGASISGCGSAGFGASTGEKTKSATRKPTLAPASGQANALPENPVLPQGRGPVNPTPLVPQSTVPSPSEIVIPRDCGPDGATQARLLTPAMDLATPGAFIQYEVFRTDCQGKVQMLTAEKIWFDLDAYGIDQDVSYIIGPQNQPGAQGILRRLEGTDLFGHSGPMWAHYETDRAITAGGTSSSVLLTIRLGGMAIAPRLQKTGRTAGSVSIPSFLRFGRALPVTKDVDVIHATQLPEFEGAFGDSGINPSYF